MDAEVSGKAFLGIMAFIKNHYGKKALADFIDTCDESTKKIFSEKIEMLHWYPYEAFAQFLETLKAIYGKEYPDLFRRLGTLAGQKDVASTYAIYKSKRNSERFVRSCGFIWTSYYRNAGEMTVVSYSPKKTVVRISNFPTMNSNHCRLMEGWISTTLMAVGYAVKNSQEIQCMSNGDPHHEFVFSTE